MPRGLMDSKERDPRNFSLAEWQQAKRMGRDPAALKATIQECWAVADTGGSFAKALEERGLYLARGDRRGHVAVTYEGEALSIARAIGRKAKEVGAKLGDPQSCRSAAEMRQHIASVISPKLEALIKQVDQDRAKAAAPLNERRLAMRDQHKMERQKLDEGRQIRAMTEAKERSERFRSGVAGLWDRLTGTHGKVRRENEANAKSCLRRDRAQRYDLISGQLDEGRGV